MRDTEISSFTKFLRGGGSVQMHTLGRTATPLYLCVHVHCKDRRYSLIFYNFPKSHPKTPLITSSCREWMLLAGKQWRFLHALILTIECLPLCLKNKRVLKRMLSQIKACKNLQYRLRNCLCRLCTPIHSCLCLAGVLSQHDTAWQSNDLKWAELPWNDQ